MHVGVEKLDATQVAQDSRRLLVTYKNHEMMQPYARLFANELTDLAKYRDRGKNYFKF